MRKIWIFLAAIVVATGLLWVSAEPRALVYKKGDAIKKYRLQSDDGTFIDTSSFKGKWVVLYFYPKDDTPGCTKEAQTFTSLIDEFTQANALVYGINTDSPESHRRFKRKYDLKVALLSDRTETVADDFGVKVIAGFCARDTVLINPKGAVEEIFRGVNPSGHPGEILKYIKDHSAKR